MIVPANNYHTNLPPEWCKNVSDRDQNRNRLRFLSSLYENACLYVETKNRNRERVHGTCDWFTKNLIFSNWATTTNQKQGLLYVTADPGCGKSVLSRYLIDEVLPLEDRVVCYFFFKDDFPDQRSCLRVVCTVLYQLFKMRPHLLTDNVLKTFKIEGERFFHSFTNLWSVFVGAATQQDTICVFDALDECLEDDRKLFVRAVTSLYAARSSNKSDGFMKCLLTSRPYDHIRRQIYRELGPEMALIHLQGDQGPAVEEISAEIRLVMDARLNELVDCEVITSEEQKSLRDKLESIPNRTYLWITLFFDGLMNAKTGVNIRQMLETPPPTVDDAYEKILNRSLHTGNERIAALQSILAAKRPLILAEMSAVLAFQAFQDSEQAQDSAPDSLVPQERFREYLRDLCGMFVVVVDDKVYLLHQTARDFLLCTAKPNPFQDNMIGQPYVWKQSITLAKSNSFLVQISVRYLLLYFKQTHRSLLEYAASNWIEHYQESGADTQTKLAVEIQELCSSPEAWVQWRNTNSADGKIPLEMTPLCTVAFLGLYETMRLMLAEHDHNLTHGKFDTVSQNDKEGYRKDEATTTATSKSNLTKKIQNFLRLGAEETISKEKSLGAYVNAKDSNGRTPLLWAAKNGHDAVVKLLLDTGEADVNIKDAKGWTPLLSAAKKGHDAVVQLLLDTKKVDLKTKRPWRNRTPLLYAVIMEHDKVVELLLETGKVDLDAQDQRGETSLSWAAQYGSEKIVKMLLNTGKVDVNLKDHRGWAPLSWAVRKGFDKVVKILLDTGKVDVDTKDRNGRTPINWAAAHIPETMGQVGNMVTIVKLLLEVGKADVALIDSYGRTPLHWAARRRSEPILKMLLDKGRVSIHSEDENGWTPLSLAAENGNEAWVPLLQSYSDVQE